ncbi:MAG TPA: PhzF family phenazine biosynthesis protein [Actinomycetota bacterium]|nr:PhzF family phenazine biosynthesis protein [Actinomycetota bacterium]
MERLESSAVRVRVVDAFTDRPFAGNPAGVVTLREARSDAWMAMVAREMNLSDTAFVVDEPSEGVDYTLRWFTPMSEVDLCGHATLASAHALIEDGASAPIRFATRSGVLTVMQNADGALIMDFPANPPVEVPAPPDLSDALGCDADWTGRSKTNFLVVLLEDEDAVHGITPNLDRLRHLDADVVVPTSPARPDAPYDFISRVFAPKIGIDEDPVTGSSHTVLAPFWAERLGKQALVGHQASSRPGNVGVEVVGDRVMVNGRAVTVFNGVLQADPG